MPIADDMEKMADDTAIKIEVSREALQKETDLKVTVEVQNKDEPKSWLQYKRVTDFGNP